MARGKAKKKKAAGKKKADGEPDKEAIAKQAVAAAKVWEAKYTATEDSRQTYRENAMKLVDENESLQTSVYKTEQDTIEVIAFLKKEEARRNEEVKELKQQLKECQVQAAREREHLTGIYEGKIATLDQALEERDHEVATLQAELELLKEFRTGKVAMEREMGELNDKMDAMASEHKGLVSRMEERFAEEKHRLQKEANRQVAGLAQKAHDMAVKNLDQKTRSVYRENVQLAEALSLHLKDAEGMRKMLEQFRAQNEELKLTKEFHEEMTKKHVAEAAKHKKVIKELQSKVKSLESSLGKVVKEFEEDKERWIRRSQDEAHQLQCEVAVLRRNAQLQAKEANHVKLLAKQLLDKRTDVEEFFITALTEVRQRAKETQSQYRHAAQEAYQQKLSEAHRGEREFPPVRTFRPLPSSTNSVYNDIERGRSWQGVESGQVDLSELTWEQKEQVLRLLFAQLNGKSVLKPSPKPAGVELETALVPVP